MKVLHINNGEKLDVPFIAAMINRKYRRSYVLNEIGVGNWAFLSWLNGEFDDQKWSRLENLYRFAISHMNHDELSRAGIERVREIDVLMIFTLLMSHGMTLQCIADRIGISASSISKYRSKIRNPNPATVEMIIAFARDYLTNDQHVQCGIYPKPETGKNE